MRRIICMQLLLLVSLCLSTYGSPHRVLTDATTQADKPNQAAMPGAGSGGCGLGCGGSTRPGCGCIGTSCGYGQPQCQQPPACGCEGSTPPCGGAGNILCGSNCIPQPIACPIGCQPAWVQPGMLQWVSNWPNYAHDGALMKNGDKEKQDSKIKENQNMDNKKQNSP